MNILRSTLFRLLTVVIYALVAMLAEAQQKRQPWGRGFSLDFAHGPIVFELLQLRQDEVHLVGEFVFENNLGDMGKSRSVVIRGKWAEGIFWPQVRLQVGDDQKGPWKSIASSKAESAHMTVPPGKGVSFRVILDPFQNFISKSRFGKVILTTGDEQIFSLSDLSPAE